MEKWSRKCAGIGDGGGGGGGDDDNVDDYDEYDENDDNDSSIGDGHNMYCGVCFSTISFNTQTHTQIHNILDFRLDCMGRKPNDTHHTKQIYICIFDAALKPLAIYGGSSTIL